MEASEDMQVEAASGGGDEMDQFESSVELEEDEHEGEQRQAGGDEGRQAGGDEGRQAGGDEGRRAEDQAVQPEQAASGSQVDDETVRRRESFGNTEIRQFLNLSPVPGADYASFYQRIVGGFQRAVDRALALAGPRDVVQVELRGQSLPSSTSMIKRGSAENSEQFETLLDQLVQSNAVISADQSLEVVIEIVRNLSGGMGQKRQLKTLMESEVVKKKRRFLHFVENTDNRCFAINLAHLLEPGLTDAQASQRGAEIHRSAGLSDGSPVTLEDVSKFENVLGRRIAVFYRSDQEWSKYVTGQLKGQRALLMLLIGGHYYGINNLKGWLGKNFACEWCLTGYDRKGSHSCSDCCSVCCDPDCPQQPLDLTYCPDCNRTCRSAYCFEKHREQSNKSQNKTSSRCETVKKCRQCNFVYYNQAHKCPKRKCKICDMPKVGPDGGASEPHRCYIQPVDIKKRHCEKLVFYDFETFVNEKGEHVPFYVSTSTFSGGSESESKSWCAEGTDCAVKFLKRFRQNRYKEYTFIAHNAKGFDSYLILKAMVEQKVTPSLIAQGSKILCFQDQRFKQRYIDSMSFLPMRLAQLPEALGFENSVKGYFPHLFSSESNLQYVGRYPPPEAYGADRMSVSDRETFMKWYVTVKDGKFDFNKEVKVYCQNDTSILRTACLRFRAQFIKDTAVDPFSCVTIASACMKVFRSHHVPLNSIAIPSPDNYRTQSKRFSAVAVQWLEWEAHNRGVSIQHALNRGEEQVGPYTVDGYAVVKNERCAFEFLGCFYHGCPTCFDPTDTNPLTGEPFGKMHQKTEKKLQLLKSQHGLHVTHMWEHDWQKMKENDQSVKTFLESFDLPEPLEPREALYGGRTSAIRLRHTAAENETVSYVDVNSLYPHVMCASECFYPLDHPVILHRDFENPQNYFGLIHAKVFPPRSLFFPVLPSRTAKGKLLFTLCRQCGELNNQGGACTHSDEERALTGVWVTPEFNKAVELGYRVGKIYEVWHFPKKSNDIFRDYMNRFLKGKQEASGFPPGVESEESKQRYIREHQEHQGIKLDPSEVRFNPAKRQIAKLCLNSLWGKFGQRSNLLNSTLITKSEEFYQYMFSDKYKIHYFTFISDQVALVQWSYSSKKCIVSPGKVNVFIAAFVTAYGRLALYEYLSQLQDRVLYHDTDSLVYVSRPGQSKLPTGERLGELKDELSGDSIEEWVTSGPKSYGYKTSSDKVVLKAKGITQNYENRQQVSFDSLSELVEGYISHQTAGTADEMIIPQSRIVRDKKGFHLRNVTFNKRYRVVYDKRRLLPSGHTLPFGY